MPNRGDQYGPIPVSMLPQWMLDVLARLLIPFTPHYTVKISNFTAQTVFSEINIFYKRVNQSGVVFLTQTNIQPGEFRYYDLGPCSEMESYVVGFFFGVNLVAQLPPEGQGNMTPALASQYKPADQDPCLDGWGISD